MAARMTPPVCASWCGAIGLDRLTWTILRGDKVMRLCSRHCWGAGRPVNPAPVEPTVPDEFYSLPRGATDADE